LAHPRDLRKLRNLRIVAMTPTPDLISAIQAFHASDYAAAATYAARAAAAAPTSLTAVAAATYLARVAEGGPAGVYVTGEAFSAFIRGGGNVPLYERTSAALRAVYAEYDQLSLLDIGVGDGLALLPALTPAVRTLDLVEPSAALLAHTCAALDDRGVAHTAHNTTIQAFAAQATERWDLAQATFSLQSLSPDERAATLRWLRNQTDRLLIVEFDVPPITAPLDPAWVAYVVERYELGLAEYAAAGDLVAQGFLMPVMFGYFDRSAARTNYEQPIAAWLDDLRAAGFCTVVQRPVYNYWWAPAVLLDARRSD
jgi:hypothetical protein